MAEPRTLDLEFFGTTHVIASFLMPVARGFVLFDPGPASALPTLERRIRESGFEIEDLQAVFATHVHLDHAGASGTLAKRTGCAVYGHPVGVPHLIDPHQKLLPSAERLYKEMLVPLWGTTEPVPEALARALQDSERVVVGGLEVVAHHTPGHAQHHVAWHVGGSVVTGDVAGVRFPGADHVLPPMPPPDIDVEAWRQSLTRLRDLNPERLLLTHFGAFDDAARHLDELEDRLLRWTEIAERIVTEGGDRAALGAELLALDEREMEFEGVAADVVARYRRLCPMEENSAGLYRYCAQHQERH